MDFGLERTVSDKAWRVFLELLDSHKSKLNDNSSLAHPIFIPSPSDRNILNKEMAQFDLESGCELETLVRWVGRGLDKGILHSGSADAYGVFNPAPNEVGILAESLAALYNPQLASSISAPFPIDVEQFVIREFAKKFSFPDSEGTFTSGGTEANFTAMISALTTRFRDFKKSGVLGLKQRPLIFVSSESHHSVIRAAQLTGLGADSIVQVPTTENHKMDTQALEQLIKSCDLETKIPIMVVGTFGSTNSGSIDSLDEIGRIAQKYHLWFHLDAAWGGAAVILPEMNHYFKGVELADSVTLDAHKWLQVPMTAGMYFTRHRGSLKRSFQVENTFYMPKQTLDSESHEPYRDSFSWSRRFRGLKLFMSLANFGWESYRSSLRAQIKLGNYLKEKLKENDFEVLNETPLPVLCFRPRITGWSSEDADLMQEKLADLGIWLTTVRLGQTQIPALRVGINHGRVDVSHLDRLIDRIRRNLPPNVRPTISTSGRIG